MLTGCIVITGQNTLSQACRYCSTPLQNATLRCRNGKRFFKVATYFRHGNDNCTALQRLTPHGDIRGVMWSSVRLVFVEIQRILHHFLVSRASIFDFCRLSPILCRD